MDPDGPLYKAVHWKYSNLRAADPGATCPWAVPDWEYAWENFPADQTPYCPEVYRKPGQDNEDWSDLMGLTMGINQPDLQGRELYLLRNLNLPQVRTTSHSVDEAVVMSS